MKYYLAAAGLFCVLLGSPSRAQYTASVKNFVSSPVLVKPLKSGHPGFMVENRSRASIAEIRFGCVKEEDGKDTVTFTFIPRRIPLNAQSRRNQATFKSWTPVQVACSNRGSKIAVIEVLFSDGKSWAAPVRFERVLDAGKRGFIVP